MNIVPISQATGKDRVSTLNFTEDQEHAYYELIDFINNEYNPNDYKRALIGPAGTGKTYLIKALIKNCNLAYSVIGLAAPTHKACRVLQESIKLPNIKVNTLQSDLGLRLNFDVEKFDITNPPFDPKGKIKIGDYQIYIVDEASMINRGLATFLENTCKTNKCKIIYIGDGSQLAPVNEKYSSALRGVKLYKLNKIVRQEDDNPMKYLLNLLRYDIEHRSTTFLQYISRFKENFDNGNTKGYKVCTTQEFDELVYNNFNDTELEHNIDFAKVIAYTNATVSAWNKYIRNAIIKDSEKSIITKNDLILSYTTIVNQFNEAVIKNSEEYILKDVVNYVHPKYNLKGFLVRFIAIHGGQVTSPLFIIDHTDNYSIQMYVEVSNSMIESAKTSPISYRSQKWRDYYTFKESCLLLTNILNRNGSILYGRDLDYGFAMTAHKCQGSTFDTALVDVNDIVYDKRGAVYTDIEEINRRLYVACSRPRNKLYLKFG